MNVNEKFFVEPGEASDEEVQRGLELLAKEKERKHKIETGQIKGDKKWADMSDDEKDKAREQGRRYNARIKLTVEAAKAAGIEITDEDVEEYLAARA